MRENLQRRLLFAPLSGSVTFQARGGFPERFLNLCNVRGVELLAPQMAEKTLTATVRRKDYRRLRDIAKRSGMSLRAVEKRGLPFFLRRNKARLALPAAAGVFLLLAVFLSGFVWSVDCEGCENVSRSEVLEVMEDLGLRPGVWRKTLDTAALGQAAMHALSGRVSWVGVNISGTRAVAEVHDYIDRGEDETFGAPANIVADFDGLLLSLKTFNGQPVARAGSGVRKGDLLISGVRTDRYGKAHFYEARGVATVLHSSTLSTEAPKNSAFTGYQKIQTVPALRFLHLTIPMGLFPPGRTFDRFTETRQAELGGVPLPLWIVRQTRCYRTDKAEETPLPLLLDDHVRAAETKYAATNVLDAALKLKPSGDRLRLTETRTCIDFAGIKEEIELK